MNIRGNFESRLLLAVDNTKGSWKPVLVDLQLHIVLIYKNRYFKFWQAFFSKVLHMCVVMHVYVRRSLALIQYRQGSITQAMHQKVITAQ